MRIGSWQVWANSSLPTGAPAGVFGDRAFSVEGKGRGDHVVKKVSVVTYQQERTVELEQAFLQQLDGLDVQVVGRLVQYE